MSSEDDRATVNVVKFGHEVYEIRERTDRQTTDTMIAILRILGGEK